MEKGFFHPVFGYWQTISEPPQTVVAGYPEGTVEVPLKPDGNWEWNGTDWVEGPPPPEPVPASLSFAQLLIGLVAEGWITEAEGDAWADGVLPASVTDLIATLPADQQFAARTRAKRPSEVLRADPMVAMLGAAQGKTPEQIDQFFRTYAGV